MKIQTNRREFLKHTLLGVGAAAGPVVKPSLEVESCLIFLWLNGL